MDQKERSRGKGETDATERNGARKRWKRESEQMRGERRRDGTVGRERSGGKEAGTERIMRTSNIRGRRENHQRAKARY